MKTRAVVIEEQGPPEVMKLVEVEVPPPGPGEVQIEQTAIGLNFMDVYQRSGHYPLSLPSRLGLEAAGRVTAIGPGVEGVAEGDRVGYAGLLGAYAGARNAPAARLIPLPEAISDEIAAAVMMKGMTVEYLLNRVHKVQPGEDVLFWAASGGVGQLAGQWGKHLGARMIGVTSGPENCEMILKLGYDAAIDRTREDVAERVRELTGGKGVSVVYDSIGKASFEASLKSLRRFGLFVSFGATTGEAPPVPPSLLQKSGSLFFTRPTLADYVAEREDLLASAKAVFDLIEKGVLKVNINQRYPLEKVVEAHRALEAGETTGSTILLP
ncbi:MAG: quinone oxidoreductase [Alphaproteobacteria bacterium]|nr:MAG: quinone oxidoreductase [Alphaproteobacteria bacterium]